MKCAFCGVETKQTVEQGNIVIIAHPGCVEDRMEQLAMDDVSEILRYEQGLIRESRNVR